MGNPYYLAMVVATVLIFFGFLMLLANRYKRCPSNRVLVIFGKVGEGMSSKTIHGGGAFVWPLIQDYDFLHLDPMQIEVPLKGALSVENIRSTSPASSRSPSGPSPRPCKTRRFAFLASPRKTS